MFNIKILYHGIILPIITPYLLNRLLYLLNLLGGCDGAVLEVCHYWHLGVSCGLGIFDGDGLRSGIDLLLGVRAGLLFEVLLF